MSPTGYQMRSSLSMCFDSIYLLPLNFMQSSLRSLILKHAGCPSMSGRIRSSRLSPRFAATAVPATLAEVGVHERDLDRLAADAMKQTRLLVNNPRELTLNDARSIYTAALHRN